MRTRMATACATVALALCTAAPALAGENGHQQDQPGPAQKAERLIRAADTFDRKAAAMRTRATRLRAGALDLRTEAEEMAAEASAGETTPEDAAARREGQEAATPPATGNPCGSWDEEEVEAARQGGHRPAPAGDEPTPDGDHAPDAEVCELLHLAMKLERRADALDVAATRMELHATRLREKAATLLQHAGETDAQRLLAKAQRLRMRAAAMRARADELRDGAFTGSDVDEHAVERIAFLEVKAARFDGAADQLEARAAAMAATPA